MEREYYMGIGWLFFVGGAAKSLGRVNQETVETMGFPFTVIIVPLIGGVSAIFLYNILAALLSYTGKWIGGSGDTNNLRTALAWSMVPNVLLFALYIPSLILFEKGIFDNETLRTYGGLTFSIKLWTFFVLQSIAYLWSIFIGINTLSVAHEYHRALSVVNYLVAFILLASPLIIIVLLILRLELI